MNKTYDVPDEAISVPAGEEISSRFMPWKGIGQMNEDELQALWMYLQSLPALEDKVKETGQKNIERSKP